MKVFTHMSVLSHPPNMQSVLQKLPNDLQTKWRKNVVKCRIKDGRVYSKDALAWHIHIFSHANSVGYGSVAYQRLYDNEGRTYCSFLMGRVRLAPIKVVTA